MTTTRYAIELEPGKWWNTYPDNLFTDFHHAIVVNDQTKKYWLAICQKKYPQARIVRVKCEVDEQ